MIIGIMTLYKEAFDYAMKEIRSEYKNKNDEEYFILWFNLQYVEDTIDTITVSVKSEFLNMRMKQMGVFETIQNKICKISGQNITLNVIIDDSDTGFIDDGEIKAEELLHSWFSEG